MTVKKILCVGGLLLVSSHEHAAAEGVFFSSEGQTIFQSSDKTDKSLINVKGVSDNKGNNTVLSKSLNVSSEFISHERRYPQVQPISSKKMIKQRRISSPVFGYHPIHFGEKKSSKPLSIRSESVSWSVPRQNWKGLNVHHHARRFDCAYIRSKTRG